MRPRLQKIACVLWLCRPAHLCQVDSQVHAVSSDGTAQPRPKSVVSAVQERVLAFSAHRLAERSAAFKMDQHLSESYHVELAHARHNRRTLDAEAARLERVQRSAMTRMQVRAAVATASALHATRHSTALRSTCSCAAVVAPLPVCSCAFSAAHRPGTATYSRVL